VFAGADTWSGDRARQYWELFARRLALESVLKGEGSRVFTVTDSARRSALTEIGRISAGFGLDIEFALECGEVGLAQARGRTA
jgi:hypothetical protein